MNWFRIVLLVLAGLLVIGVIAALALGVRITAFELRSFDGDVAISRADAYEATITRDEWGIPRIIGPKDTDVAFGFAFAHAEDDFKTIQSALRNALGPDMLAKSESEARTAYLVQALGMLSTVETSYEEQVSAETRAFLSAYADGLNYYAALHPDERVPDLFPVTGEDVAALSAFFSPLFYGMSRTLTAIVNPDAVRDVSRGQQLQVLLDEAGTKEMGSNAFAIAPSRSDDGATRLIVNSHQPVTGPLAWYETHFVSGEGMEMAGGAFPGAPYIHLGANEAFAFTATVNSPDLIDVYELTLTEDGERYILDGEEREFETSQARMLVKVFGPLSFSAKRPIERSVHGPVLRTPRGAFAVRFATMDDLSAADQSLDMMQARSLAEFDTIMREGTMGATNRIVADTTGRIARYYNAHMPVRQDVEGLDWEGYLPGDRADLVWTSFEPYDALPHMIDPAAGYVLDSNHTPFKVTLGPDDPLPEAYPERFGIETNMTNRALRATKLFAEDADGKTSREELLAAKYDHVYDPDSFAFEMRDALLAMDWSGDPELAPALEIIRGWDGSADRANRGAALSLMTYQPVGVAIFLDQEPPALDETFREAVATLESEFGRLDPTWEEVNRLRRGDVDIGLQGGPDTLRAVNSAPDEDGRLKMNSGDGMTMLWEHLEGGETRLWSVHQFGASSREASPHFTDQMQMFADEAFRPVPLGEDAVRAAAVQSYAPGER